MTTLRSKNYMRKVDQQPLDFRLPGETVMRLPQKLPDRKEPNVYYAIVPLTYQAGKEDLPECFFKRFTNALLLLEEMNKTTVQFRIERIETYDTNPVED